MSTNTLYDHCTSGLIQSGQARDALTPLLDVELNHFFPVILLLSSFFFSFFWIISSFVSCLLLSLLLLLASDQLERVFLRLGHADTDEQLQDVISKFLPPVLLKLSSAQEGVRKKVSSRRGHVHTPDLTRLVLAVPWAQTFPCGLTLRY